MNKTSGCLSVVERTVWDGDQVLWEVRADGDDAATKARMEADGVGPYVRAKVEGRVMYTHGAGIDHPLAIGRLYNNVGVIVPQYDWRGNATAGYCTNATACSRMTWPEQLQSPWAEDPKPSDTNSGVPVYWAANLIDTHKDGSGYVYMRNRYYDPSSGRFTQVDPIGLAGGLNAYGFAGGDPVNFSDPFGLKTCPPACGEVFTQLGQMAPAINQATVAFAGVSVAGGVAGAAVATGEGASAAAIGLSRTYVGRALLPVVASAIGKLENLAEKFDMSPTEIANKAISVGEQMIDHANGGNINNLLQRPDGVSGFIRVTTDPNAQKIISAGLQSAKMVANGIASGRFTPIQ